MNRTSIFFGQFVALVDPIYFTQIRFTLFCVFDPISFYPITFDSMVFDPTSLGRLFKHFGTAPRVLECSQNFEVAPRGFRVKCENLSDIFRNFL